MEYYSYEALVPIYGKVSLLKGLMEGTMLAIVSQATTPIST